MNQDKPIPASESSCTATPQIKSYSAKELGDFMNNNPQELLNMNIGYQTRWYDCDFIEEVLSYVREEQDMQQFMTLIVEDWRVQTVQLHPRVAYRDPKTKEKIAYVSDLDIKLEDIHRRLMADREQLAHSSTFRDQFRKFYSRETVSANLMAMNGGKPQKTDVPSYENCMSSQEGHPVSVYSLEDFDSRKLSILLISDNETFSQFVTILRDEVWPKILENKNKYCNVFRFFCRVHEIVARNSTMSDFDEMLQELIPGIGSQLSSMKQRQDANKDRNLKNYLDPVKKKSDDCWKLTRDCAEFETMLEPLIEKIKDNQEITLR